MQTYFSKLSIALFKRYKKKTFYFRNYLLSENLQNMQNIGLYSKFTVKPYLIKIFSKWKFNVDPKIIGKTENVRKEKMRTKSFDWLISLVGLAN